MKNVSPRRTATIKEPGGELEARERSIHERRSRIDTILEEPDSASSELFCVDGARYRDHALDVFSELRLWPDHAVDSKQFETFLLARHSQKVFP
jgi:hypothetical protein